MVQREREREQGGKKRKQNEKEKNSLIRFIVCSIHLFKFLQKIGALRALKAELRAGGEGSSSGSSGGGGGSSGGFGSPAPSTSSSSSSSAKPYSSLSRQEKQRQLEKSRDKQLRDWQLTPAKAGEWREWLDNAASRAGLPGTTFWVQVQLDGSVRSSGTGAPRWDSIVRDLAPLDSMLTKFTDGAAR